MKSLTLSFKAKSIYFLLVILVTYIASASSSEKKSIQSPSDINTKIIKNFNISIAELSGLDIKDQQLSSVGDESPIIIKTSFDPKLLSVGSSESMSLLETAKLWRDKCLENKESFCFDDPKKIIYDFESILTHNSKIYIINESEDLILELDSKYQLNTVFKVNLKNSKKTRGFEGLTYYKQNSLLALKQSGKYAIFQFEIPETTAASRFTVQSLQEKFAWKRPKDFDCSLNGITQTTQPDTYYISSKSCRSIIKVSLNSDKQRFVILSTHSLPKELDGIEAISHIRENLFFIGIDKKKPLFKNLYIIQL